jgi:hypothetical protein
MVESIICRLFGGLSLSFKACSINSQTPASVQRRNCRYTVDHLPK